MSLAVWVQLKMLDFLKYFLLISKLMRIFTLLRWICADRCLPLFIGNLWARWHEDSHLSAGSTLLKSFWSALLWYSLLRIHFLDVNMRSQGSCYRATPTRSLCHFECFKPGGWEEKENESKRLQNCRYHGQVLMTRPTGEAILSQSCCYCCRYIETFFAIQFI